MIFKEKDTSLEKVREIKGHDPFKQEFRDQLRPSELGYRIVSNLQVFDNKPDCVFSLLEKLQKLQKLENILGTSFPITVFTQFFDKAVNEFYQEHNKFPDPEWLNAALPRIDFRIFERDTYSTAIYEDFSLYLDKQILKGEAQQYITDADDLSSDNCQEMIRKLSKYVDKNREASSINKDFILNLYDKYEEEYDGVETHVKLLDNVIGKLGFKSFAVVGAPTGAGKTILANTITYNASVFGGKVIDYVTFEVPMEHMWFSINAVESTYLGYNIVAGDMKECVLTDVQKAQYKECAISLMNKLNESGGFINIIDVTKLSVDSFEGLCSRLESVAEERGRAADLIIIDNIDGFKSFKSTERDTDTKVNNMILELDLYSKTYYNNKGTCFLLLTQLSQEGIFKVQKNCEKGPNGEVTKKKVVVDSTVFRQYRALGDKGTVNLVLYSNETMRSMGRCNIIPVKIRNRPVPTEHLELTANYACSRIGGLTEKRSSKEFVDEYINDVETYEKVNTEEIEEIIDD